MNKFFRLTFLSAFLLASATAYASSTIDIATPTDVVAANTEMEMNLNALTAKVPYMITCDLESSSPSDLDAIFTPALSPNGGYGVNTANGKPMMKNIGTFHSGKNTLSFMASVDDNQKSNKIVMKNLDNKFSVSVKACQAKPVSNVTAASNRVAGGYFYITNHLPYYVDVTVGNYAPTPYCIPPGYMQYVSVSTAYQNIDVIGTHY